MKRGIHAVLTIAVALVMLVGILAGTAAAGTIVCIGDSITSGRIPWRLSDDMAAMTGESWKVYDFGYGGYTTADLRDLCGSSGWWNLKADYVFIMCGTNDAVHSYSKTAAVANVQAIVNMMARGGSKIIVAEIPPSGNRGETGWAIEYNSLLRSRLSNVGYIMPDNFNDFYNADNGTANWDLMDDRLHPNAAGQKIMAQNYADVVYSVWRDPFWQKESIYASAAVTSAPAATASAPAQDDAQESSGGQEEVQTSSVYQLPNWQTSVPQ